MQSVTIDGPRLGCGEVCRQVLADLPAWFGIDEATRTYIETVETLPTFVARINGLPVGFMSLRSHSPQSAELHVLGVLRAYHRQGIGSRLLHACEHHLQSQGVRFLQVKTVALEAGSAEYQQTLRFYEAAGFVALEVFPDLWDERNPCLQMIKRL